MTKKLQQPKDMPKRGSLWVLIDYKDLMTDIVEVKKIGSLIGEKVHMGQLPNWVIYHSRYSAQYGVAYTPYAQWYTTWRSLTDREQSLLLLRDQFGESNLSKDAIETLLKAKF